MDTATGPCSVAVWKEGVVAAYVEQIKPTQQSACLMPMVEEAMAIAGVSYAQLGAVACTTGPGSFTGIRVGLAAANGIAFAAGLTGLGFGSLEVLAFAALSTLTDKSMILAVLNAGKGEFYFQAFAPFPFTALSEPMLGSLEQAAGLVHGSVVQCGNAPLAAAGFVDAGITFPRADALAGLAAIRTDAVALRPFYIRGPDAKLPTKVG